MNGMQQIASLMGANGIDMRSLAQILQLIGAQNSKGGQDTILAHINPQEYQYLLQQGGSGRPDPVTGAPHFEDGGDGDGGEGDGGPGSDGDADGGGGYGEGGPGGATAGSENAAHGENSADTAGRDASYGGDWGGDQEGGGDDAVTPTSFTPSVSRISTTPLSQDDVAKLSKADDKTTGYAPGFLGAFGFNLGTTPNVSGLLDPTLGSTKATNNAIGFSQTALGLGLLDSVIGAPVSSFLNATGIYSPNDYTTVADLGNIGQQSPTSHGELGDSNNGQMPPGTPLSPQTPTSTPTSTTPAVSSPSVLSMLQSLFGAGNVYGVRA